MCDTYNMGTETPVGYRLVRVGVRGRVPTLHTRAPEDLTTRQKYDLRYRRSTAPSSSRTIANITRRNAPSERSALLACWTDKIIDGRRVESNTRAVVHAVTFLAVHAVVIINPTHSARLGIGVLEIQCIRVRT